AMGRELADLTARLEEKIADQTSARTEIGTSTHTAHRQLASQVSGLCPRVHRVARAWAREENASTSRRSLSEFAAVIFPLLFAHHRTPEDDCQRWAAFSGVNAEARTLAQDAAELGSQITDLAGYQQWIWDMVPAGTTFDPDMHMPWQSCDDT